MWINQPSYNDAPRPSSNKPKPKTSPKAPAKGLNTPIASLEINKPNIATNQLSTQSKAPDLRPRTRDRIRTIATTAKVLLSGADKSREVDAASTQLTQSLNQQTPSANLIAWVRQDISHTLQDMTKETVSAVQDLMDRMSLLGELSSVDPDCVNDCATLDWLIDDFVKWDVVIDRVPVVWHLSRVRTLLKQGRTAIESAMDDKWGERATLNKIAREHPAMLQALRTRTQERIGQDANNTKLQRLITRIDRAQTRANTRSNSAAA